MSGLLFTVYSPLFTAKLRPPSETRDSRTKTCSQVRKRANTPNRVFSLFPFPFSLTPPHTGTLCLRAGKRYLARETGKQKSN
jgi:hypothetical protein